MKYQQAEGLGDLFWQKMRNPLTLWPRVILTLLILIAVWSHAIWWVIFLLFLEAAILFFAPPALNYDGFIPRVTDGWRIWNVVRSPVERFGMIFQLTIGAIAFFCALWAHSWFWTLLFAVQVAGTKYLLCIRFLAMARLVDYDIQKGLTVADLQEISSRCDNIN